MIILMITLYHTVHVGDHIHYNVSENTWQCYCRFIRALQNEGVVSLCFQGGWGVKMREQNGYDST